MKTRIYGVLFGIGVLMLLGAVDASYMLPKAAAGAFIAFIAGWKGGFFG